MFDRLRSKEAATISAALALAIGVAACGDGGGGDTTNASSEQSGLAKRVPVSPSIHLNYFSDGTREINTSDAHKETTGSYIDNIYQFCLGGSLYSETESAGGIDIDDTPQAIAACADGKLTPSDFAATPSK